MVRTQGLDKPTIFVLSFATMALLNGMNPVRVTDTVDVSELGTSLISNSTTEYKDVSLCAGVARVFSESLIGNNDDMYEGTEKFVDTYHELDKVMFTNARVNMRTEPIMDSSNVYKLLDIGTEIYVEGYTDSEWYAVSYEGSRYYINSNYLQDDSPFILVSSTAYYNPNNNKTADMSETIEDFTLAGRIEWLGKSCYIYECNEDGSVGSCRGYYEFHDTGWGIDGDILRGETIDFYMEDEADCRKYGRQNVYVYFID